MTSNIFKDWLNKLSLKIRFLKLSKLSFHLNLTKNTLQQTSSRNYRKKTLPRFPQSYPAIIASDF